MSLSQLEGLVRVDSDTTDPQYGVAYDKRSIQQQLSYGIILLDKPPGPTSHETVAWTKRMLGVPKIGHSGTLDPQVSGVLPLGLGEATKALGVLLHGPKEYYAVCRFHVLPRPESLESVMSEFCGPIYQKPPQRSSVARRTRTRTIHQMDLIEQKAELALIRVVCESGTYIRKLLYDMGEVLGPGATMIELRRSRVHQFHESRGLTTLHQLSDAHATWKESGDPGMLSSLILPVEAALSEIKSVVVRDSAVDAICHGAQLAVPGILEVSPGMAAGDAVAVYTQKGEAVALAECLMGESKILESKKGCAFETRRIIMAPGTYPRMWRSRGRHEQ